MAPAFNPIDYSSELEAAGVPKAQAAVHARALSTVLTDVAFTHDLVRLEGNLRKEIQHSEEKLTARIESVRTDLSSKIDSLRMETNVQFTEASSRFTETDSKLQAMRLEMGFHRWALGTLLAISTMTLALVIKPLLG